jgi:hypothetical protein
MKRDRDDGGSGAGDLTQTVPPQPAAVHDVSNPSLADQIVCQALFTYGDFPQHVKPNAAQSAVLAAMVLVDPSQPGNPPRVVAVGMGTRCVGFNPATQPQRRALAVYDCHAEVLCRRAFVAWMAEEARRALMRLPCDDFVSVVTESDGARRVTVKPEYEVYLAVTKTPCGDCCIARSQAQGNGAVAVADGSAVATGGRKVVRRQAGAPGAAEHQDIVGDNFVSRHCNGIDDFEIGAARVKPGKGHPSLCMSCSDKIAKWVYAGLTPSAMLLALPSVRLHGLVIADASADLSAVSHALTARGAGLSPRTDFACLATSVHISQHVVRVIARPSPALPSTVSVVWRRSPPSAKGETNCGRGAITIYNSKAGLPQGVAEKTVDELPSSSVTLTPLVASGARLAGVVSLHWRLFQLAQLERVLRPTDSPLLAGEELTYRAIKTLSQAGRDRDAAVLRLKSAAPFDNWVTKDRVDFHVSIVS